MAPRIRIPAHVFGYGLASVPAIAYALYWKRNHQTDEELEDVLQERYSNKIQGNRDKKQDMVNFFAAMKDPSANPEQKKRMEEVLYGGKGDKKRHYAVDDKLYGTDEGVEKRIQAETDADEKVKVKRKMKKRKKKKKKGAKVVQAEVEENTNTYSKEKMGVAAVGAVGVLALASLLVGGKRS